MADAEQEIRRYESLRSYRGNFEYTWQQIAEVLFPRMAGFTSRSAPGERLEQKVFDSTAQLALPAFASAMESMLTPRTSKWHTLVPADPELLMDRDVAIYLEKVRNLMFALRYAPTANFASQVYEHYMGLGAFGTSSVFIKDGLSKGIRYQTIPLRETFFAENADGVIDTCYRVYELTTMQAHQKFGDDLPEDIRKCKEKEPDRNWEFLHCVCPNELKKHGDKTYRGMDFYACDISMVGKRKLREGGYRTFPYAVGRYVTGPREIYGRSPAWDALADIKTLNEMVKTSLRYGQMVTDPPWITADLDGLSPFKLRPGAINAGFMSDQGVPLAKSIAPEGDPRITLEMADQRRQSINRAFLVTLFQILVDTPQMTATEAMLRAQEKGALLAPTVGRQQSEFLGPIINRELDILDAAGALAAIGPPPPALVQRGGRLDVRYDSPLSRAQMTEEGLGIMRTLEQLVPLANIDPAVMDDINVGRTFQHLARINGAPLDIMATEDEKAAKQQAKAQQQQLENLVAAGPAVGDTVKSLAQAAQSAGAARF